MENRESDSRAEYFPSDTEECDVCETVKHTTAHGVGPMTIRVCADCREKPDLYELVWGGGMTDSDLGENPLPALEPDHPSVRDHPYKEYEGSKVWKAVAKAIRDLEGNDDLVLKELRPYVVGYICKVLVKRRVAQHSKGTRKRKKAK